MAIQVQIRRGTAAQLAAFTPADGELVADTTNRRLFLGDGATEGGIEVGAGLPASAYGATAQWMRYEGEVTLSGATTEIVLAQDCVLYAVSLRVTEAVTGATSITVNDATSGNGHWGSGIGVSAGSTSASMAAPGGYYAGSESWSTHLSLAAVGGAASFSAGKVRYSILALVITPPTS